MTLPLLDEHSATIAAPRPAVWEAVRSLALSLAESEHAVLGVVLGTVPRSGFRLDGEVDGREVALAGRHRFARYRLLFAVSDAPGGATTLSVQSYASFPGLRGRLYRSLLLGTRGHLLAVRGMIRQVRRSCE